MERQDAPGRSATARSSEKSPKRALRNLWERRPPVGTRPGGPQSAYSGSSGWRVGLEPPPGELGRLQPAQPAAGGRNPRGAVRTGGASAGRQAEVARLERRGVDDAGAVARRLDHEESLLSGVAGRSLILPEVRDRSEQSQGPKVLGQAR